MRLCAAVLGLVGGGRAMDDNTIKAAVELWESDRAAAEAQYGPISAWDTADVVDMEKLFHFSTDFNEDIGAWNTSSVTSMNRMFWYAIDFDQPIGVFAASDSSAPPGAEPAQAPGTSARSRTLSACSATRRCSTKTSVRFCRVLFVFGLGYENAIAAIGLSSPIRYRRNSPSTRTLARDQHAIAATVRAEKNTHQHAIAAISDPRRRLARRQRRDHRPHVLRRLGLRPGPRLVHARDRGPGVSHDPVPVAFRKSVRLRRPARRPCRGAGGARGVRAREDAGADARPGGASLQRRPLRRAEVPKSRFLSATGPNSAGPRCVRRLQVHYEEG